MHFLWIFIVDHAQLEIYLFFSVYIELVGLWLKDSHTYICGSSGRQKDMNYIYLITCLVLSRFFEIYFFIYSVGIPKSYIKFEAPLFGGLK